MKRKFSQFGYDARSELTSATLGNAAYAYAFDNVGNRSSATEAGTQLAYTTNAQNQYPTLTKTPAQGQTQYFTPTYDADGNAELVWTETGIWVVSYDAKNRPVSFRDVSTGTLVECAYDYRGRRCTKKVTVAGTVTLHERYIYRDYLQIACVDLTRAAHPALWFVLWDPSQETATRPLAIQKDGTWYTYGCDITKFGAVTATGDVSQPFQWSSEFYDSELDLVYYNYRHYSPTDGRWLSRDPIQEQGGRNLYGFVGNSSLNKTDLLGQKECLCPCSDYSKTRWKGGLTWEGRSFRTKSGHNPSVNGCGPENGFLNTGLDIVPDSFFGKVFFNSACNIHDRCYGQICVSSPEHKKLCDEELERDMLKACTAAFRAGRISPAERWLCEKQAKIYYNAVLSMGGGAFEDAQDDACVWEECKLF